MSGCRKRFITLQPRSRHGTRAYILVTSEKGLNAAPSASSSAWQHNYFTKIRTLVWASTLGQFALHGMQSVVAASTFSATISILDPAVDAKQEKL